MRDFFGLLPVVPLILGICLAASCTDPSADEDDGTSTTGPSGGHAQSVGAAGGTGGVAAAGGMAGAGGTGGMLDPPCADGPELDADAEWAARAGNYTVMGVDCLDWSSGTNYVFSVRANPKALAIQSDAGDLVFVHDDDGDGACGNDNDPGFVSLVIRDPMRAVLANFDGSTFSGVALTDDINMAPCLLIGL